MDSIKSIYISTDFKAASKSENNEMFLYDSYIVLCFADYGYNYCTQIRRLSQPDVVLVTLQDFIFNGPRQPLLFRIEMDSIHAFDSQTSHILFLVCVDEMAVYNIKPNGGLQKNTDYELSKYLY